MVHGNDFVTVGERQNCEWLRQKLEMRFDIETTTIGHEENESKEERILNRIIRATEKGWETEADQRHADILITELNLKSANGVTSPGEDEKKWDDEENIIMLEVRENIASWRRGRTIWTRTDPISNWPRKKCAAACRHPLGTTSPWPSGSAAT